MNVTITMTENLEELPGSGGSFGVNRFLREDYPEGTEEIDPYIISLSEMADNVDTNYCDFYVVSNVTKKVAARGTIENGKRVIWDKENSNF